MNAQEPDIRPPPGSDQQPPPTTSTQFQQPPPGTVEISSQQPVAGPSTIAPPTARAPASLEDDGSPSNPVETVREYLNERPGQHLNEVEVAGLVHLLEQSVPSKSLFY